MNINSIHKNLIRRYLIWGYKTTKESFERIERKTTQLKVDEYISRKLNYKKVNNKDYQKLIHEFELYIKNKIKEKRTYHPQYLYLKNRLTAIEEAIKYFLGKKELTKIEKIYEQEFVERILKARDH